MADAALYRQIVDVLLAEHEKSTPPQPRDADTTSMLSVTWGLYCQVHRLARASMLLADNGMDQEGVVLDRVMLEHTIVLHWVIARGDDGIEAMRASQSKQMRKWLDKTRDTTLTVPPEIAAEITASFTGIDEAKATGFFSDICHQVGCKDLYAVYGIWSQTVHPSLATSNTYVDPVSGGLQLTPTRDHASDVMLVAHCLIWAQRALDRLLSDPDRAQGLEKLASAIGAVPVLPGYQPPVPPAPRGPGGSRTSGAGRAAGRLAASHRACDRPGLRAAGSAGAGGSVRRSPGRCSPMPGTTPEAKVPRIRATYCCHLSSWRRAWACRRTLDSR